MTGNSKALEKLVRQFDANRESIKSGAVVLATHLGLGDQITASRIIERLLDRGVEVFLPVKSMYMEFMTKVFGGWQGLRFFRVGNSYDFELTRISYHARMMGVKVLNLGHRSYPTARRLFPEFPITSVFNILGGVPPHDVVSSRFRSSLFALPQIQPRTSPYAFVDHHPGTWREIDGVILNRLKDAGLEIVFNPRDSPLYSTLKLMDSAAEVHLVPSAPLCMALTADIQSPKRVHHDFGCDPVSPIYTGWMVTSPTGCRKPREVPIATRELDVRDYLLSGAFLDSR